MSRRRSETTILARRHLRARDRRIETNQVFIAHIGSAAFRCEVVALEAALPAAETGRPRKHSTAALWFLDTAAAHFGSVRKAHAHLAFGHRWEQYRRHLAQCFPDDPLLGPGSTLPSRAAYHWFLRRVAEHGEMLREVFSRNAVAMAHEMGIGSSAGGTLLEPALARFFIGDGVVLPACSMYPPGTTAQCEGCGYSHDRRADLDAAYHTTGGGKQVYGNKFVFWSATTGEPGETITLDVSAVRKQFRDHEAGVAVDALTPLAELMPDMSGVLYDKALRGALVDDVWNLGLHPVVPVYEKTGKSTEVYPLGTHTLTLADGTKTDVELAARRGQAGFHSVVAGTRHWAGLDATKVTKRPSRSGGPDAVYIHYRIADGTPCDPRRWGATVVVRANPTGVSRGEYLRALPLDDPRYSAIYGHRQRAEMLNETVKYRLPNRRARSYGQARQLINMISTASVRNTEAVLHWRARTTAHAPPLAA